MQKDLLIDNPGHLFDKTLYCCQIYSLMTKAGLRLILPSVGNIPVSSVAKANSLSRARWSEERAEPLGIWATSVN